MRYIACKNDRHLHPRPNAPSSLTEVYSHTPDMRSFRPRAILGSYGARGKSLHSSCQDTRRSLVGAKDTPRPASGSNRATTPYLSTTFSQVFYKPLNPPSILVLLIATNVLGVLPVLSGANQHHAEV